MLANHHYIPQFKIIACDTPPVSCDLDEEPSHQPSEKDLDLAKHLRPNLSVDNGVWTDGVLSYYPAEIEVPVRSIRLNKPRTEKRVVWIRSLTICHPGGHWDPPEYDEALADADNAVFDTLSDAIKQTMLDEFALALYHRDNHCATCSGLGYIEEIDDLTTCRHCANKGWLPMPPPAPEPPSSTEIRQTIENLIGAIEDPDEEEEPWQITNGREILAKLP